MIHHFTTAIANATMNSSLWSIYVTYLNYLIKKHTSMAVFEFSKPKLLT